MASVGQGIDRYEGRLKVTGRADYAADRRCEGLAHVAGVFSQVASGRVVAIDCAAAERAPGVLAVLRHGHCPKVKRSPNAFGSATKVGEVRPPFEDDRVYYFGQYLAAVVAETWEQAKAAAALVRVTVAREPIQVALDDGQWPGERKPDPETPDYSRGDPEQGWAKGDAKVDATYATATEVHNAMELHSTVARWVEGGKLEVHDSTQWVVGTRGALAAMLGLRKEQVTVLAHHIGGGFGGKLFVWPGTVVAALAAKAVKRPVKLVTDRHQEGTTAGHRPETRQRVRLAATKEGVLTLVRHDAIAATSKVDDFIEDAAETSKTLYRCPHAATTQRIVPLHIGTPTSMRAPGAASGLFALESAMDELAVALGMDPIELRRKNDAQRDGESGLPYSSKHLTACFDSVAKRFGWAKRKAGIGSMRAGTEIIGWGFATATWPALRKNSRAKVELFREGRAKVYCATQDIGTGTYTVIAQVAADALRLPVSKVEVAIGNSDYPEGPISGGSMATASFVPAVMAACEDALKKLKGGRRESVVGEGETAPGAERKKFSFRSFGAHAVEVRWDPGIGRLRVARVVTAIDAGKILNPKTAHNQIAGGIVMGIGMGLREESVYDSRDGRTLSDSLAEYLVPVNADIPPLDIEFLEFPDRHMGGHGGHGVGEIGICGVAAALANAVYHATGQRIREIPIKVEDLL